MKNYLKLVIVLGIAVHFISCSKSDDTQVTDIVAIDLTPSTLNFGDTNASGSTQSFTIINKGNVPLNISNITCSNINYYIYWSSGTVAVNSSKNVNVSFFPSTNQQQNGQIAISSNANDTKYITVSGKGSCNGYGFLNLTNTSTTVHKVYIDGADYGQLNVNQSKEYSLPSGNHSFTIPSLNGTSGCTTPTNVVIVECNTQYYNCQYN